MKSTYLGDGVYIELSNHGVVITTTGGTGDNNTIYLDTCVLEALEAWLKSHRERKNLVLISQSSTASRS